MGSIQRTQIREKLMSSPFLQKILELHPRGVWRQRRKQRLSSCGELLVCTSQTIKEYFWNFWFRRHASCQGTRGAEAKNFKNYDNNHSKSILRMNSGVWIKCRFTNMKSLLGRVWHLILGLLMNFYRKFQQKSICFSASCRWIFHSWIDIIWGPLFEDQNLLAIPSISRCRS